MRRSITDLRSKNIRYALVFRCNVHVEILAISPRDLIIGKEAVSYVEKVLSKRNQANGRKARLRWAPIDQAHVSLNVDGSFVPATGAAGADIVLRNTSGEIIFTACRELLTT